MQLSTPICSHSVKPPRPPALLLRRPRPSPRLASASGPGSAARGLGLPLLPAVASAMRRRGHRRAAPPPGAAAGGGEVTVPDSREKRAGTDLKTLAARFWKVAAPYWWSEDKTQARLRLAAVFALTLGTTGISVGFNFLGRDFYNALADKDQERFTQQLLYYLGAFAGGIPFFVLRDYAKETLSLRWRSWMTSYYMKRYLTNRTFYKIQSQSIIDNPDQRINDDLSAFTGTALAFSLTLFNAAVDLISFSNILYGIYPPLFIVLVVYSLGGTAISVFLGKNLVNLNFMQEKKEADFRYGLVRVRENAESIAFYGGEENELQLLLDRFRRAFDNLSAPLINRAGRLVLVRAVLTAAPIYLLIALDLPKWAIKAIDKKRRGFLWKGQEQANGGNCLVSWEKVQWPLEYGGLGILNLELLGWALRIRWLWTERTDPLRPWAGLPVQVPHKARALYQISVDAVLGNGEAILFWTDRWLNGHTMAELAPNLFNAVPKRTAKRRMVAQALQNRGWVADIKGALTVQVLIEYLQTWDMVDGLILQPEVPDHFTWKLTQSGTYTSKSAYAAFFVGSIKFGPWKRIWKNWAPRCKFFIWLVFQNRCWTADRLAKRGLAHPLACPLCDQAEETIHHLLVGCVFTRQIWALILHQLGLSTLSPDLQPQGSPNGGGQLFLVCPRKSGRASIP